jgi:Zn-dependent protease
VAGAVLFYACLLAHELAHALLARSRGVKVAGITLWLFGGVSRLEGEPGRPGVEALITAVGPLTSIVVGAVLYALAIAGAALGAPALAVDLLGWLALINVVLAAFNLLPAFPLDGGRLLSAFFWWRYGTREQGVRHAVRVGRVIAALMIAAGLVGLFVGALVDGIWIAFVGWFLFTAAGAEETAATARAALRSVPVSAAMTSPVITVPEWLTVDQLLGSVATRYRFTTFPLTDRGGTVSGVVRLKDLLRIPPSERALTAAREKARPVADVPQASPDEDLAHLVERLGARLDERVLVFEHPDGARQDRSLAGILSPADIARAIAPHDQRRAGGWAR